MSAINPHTGRPYDDQQRREDAAPDTGPAGEMAEGQPATEKPAAGGGAPGGGRSAEPGPAGEIAEAPAAGSEAAAGPETQGTGGEASAGVETHGTGGATMSQQELAIRAALETVMDPEIMLSVIDLGLIREVHVLDGRTLVRMMLTTPFCPYAPQLMEEVKAATMSVVPQPCEVEILPDAWSPDLMPDPGLLGFSF